jgi:stage II sporulation SpoAA-like protein
MTAQWGTSPARQDGAMDDRIRFITHKDKRILLVDASNCTAAELETMSKLVPTYVTAEPRGSVLLLADFTNAEFHRDFIDWIKPVIVRDRPHLKRSAWVGAERIPKAIYEGLKSFSKRDLPMFKTREEALEWLIKEQ